MGRLAPELPYADRRAAGRALATLLPREDDTIVLGLPRGGVPVAAEVARALQAELDVYVVRKLGVPWQPELAFGALATGGTRVLNEEVVRQLGLGAETIAAVTHRELERLHAQEARLRRDRPAPRLRGRRVVIVDDGLATGATMRAAVTAAQVHEPRSVLAAVPVGAEETCRLLERAGIELVCAASPSPFLAVGEWYDDFSQVSDCEVVGLVG
jgi:putative phosphoribosyl transferase